MKKSKSFDAVFWRNRDLKVFPSENQSNKIEEIIKQVIEGVAGEKWNLVGHCHFYVLTFLI